MHHFSQLITRHDAHIREQLLGTSIAGRTPFSKSDKRKLCCWFTCFPILLILVVQLTFAPTLIAQTVRNKINNAFIFTKPEPDNPHYKTWLTNSDKGSVPIRFGIQFFNITNPDAVLRGQMPNLHLTESLVYNQYYFRQNVTFSDDLNWVSHRFHTEYLLSCYRVIDD